MEELQEAFQEVAATAKPLVEIIGAKLPRQFCKFVSPKHYELLQVCEPFGTQSVREVAKEMEIRPERLWDWLRNARRRLELKLVELVPRRACYMTELGREVREKSGRLPLAEEYLKGLERLIPNLGLPEKLRIWTHAKCSLELGHVYRDRGGSYALHQAPAMYRQACAGFLELADTVTGEWGDPSVTCGWIVAVQNLIMLERAKADYEPDDGMRFCKAALARSEQLMDELDRAPRRIERYRERIAENQKLLGDLHRLLGDPQKALTFVEKACDSEAGPIGDHIGRRRNRARIYGALQRFDDAFADLEFVEQRMKLLSKEIGIREVLLNVDYCELYLGIGDHEGMRSLAETTLDRARQMGLNHQFVKLKRLLARSS